MVFFDLVTTVWIFDISLCENSINQSCSNRQSYKGSCSFVLDVKLVDAPAGVTQEEGHTGFLHLPSMVLA